MTFEKNILSGNSGRKFLAFLKRLAGRKVHHVKYIGIYKQPDRNAWLPREVDGVGLEMGHLGGDGGTHSCLQTA